MKYINFFFLSALLNVIFPCYAAAQVKSETQEIIIKKNGDKPTKLTLEIEGGKVSINGKPLAEFKEDGVTINNRKMIIREDKKITMDFGNGIGDLSDNFGALKDLKSIDIQRLNPDRIDMDVKVIRKGAMLGVMLKDADNKGALIEDVTENSAAAKAGLKQGDIIYKIDDVNVKEPKNVMDFIKTKKKDDVIKIYYERVGDKKETSATLMSSTGNYKEYIYENELPNATIKSYSYPQMRDYNMPEVFEMPNRLFVNKKTKLGIKIQDTEEGNGVKILLVEDDLVGAKAGLKKDDIITHIADKKITNTDEIRDALQENRNNLNYDIKVLRSGKPLTIAVKIPKQLKTANL
jgi:serine protease Do